MPKTTKTERSLKGCTCHKGNCSNKTCGCVKRSEKCLQKLCKCYSKSCKNQASNSSEVAHTTPKAGKSKTKNKDEGKSSEINNQRSRSIFSPQSSPERQKNIPDSPSEDEEKSEDNTKSKQKPRKTKKETASLNPKNFKSKSSTKAPIESIRKRSHSSSDLYQVAYNTRSRTNGKNEKNKENILRRSASTNDLDKASTKKVVKPPRKAKNNLLESLNPKTPKKPTTRGMRKSISMSVLNEIPKAKELESSQEAEKNIAKNPNPKTFKKPTTRGLRRSVSMSALNLPEMKTNTANNANTKPSRKRKASPSGKGDVPTSKAKTNSSNDPVSKARPRRNQIQSPNPKNLSKPNESQIRNEDSADEEEESIPNNNRSRRNQSKSPNPRKNQAKSPNPRRNQAKSPNPKRNKAKSPNPKNLSKPNDSQIRNEDSADEEEESIPNNNRSRRNHSKSPNPRKNQAKSPNLRRNQAKSPNPRKNQAKSPNPKRNQAKSPNPKILSKPNESQIRNEDSADEEEESIPNKNRSRRNQLKSPNPRKNQAKSPNPRRNQAKSPNPKRNQAKSPDPKSLSKPNGSPVRNEDSEDEAVEQSVPNKRSRRNQSKSPNPKRNPVRSPNPRQNQAKSPKPRKNQTKKQDPKILSKPNGFPVRNEDSEDEEVAQSISNKRPRRNQSKSPNPKRNPAKNFNPKSLSKHKGSSVRNEDLEDEEVEQSVPNKRSGRNPARNLNPRGTKKPDDVPLSKDSAEDKEEPVSEASSRRNQAENPNSRNSESPLENREAHFSGSKTLDSTAEANVTNRSLIGPKIYLTLPSTEVEYAPLGQNDPEIVSEFLSDEENDINLDEKSTRKASSSNEDESIIILPTVGTNDKFKVVSKLLNKTSALENLNSTDKRTSLRRSFSMNDLPQNPNDLRNQETFPRTQSKSNLKRKVQEYSNVEEAKKKKRVDKNEEIPSTSSDHQKPELKRQSQEGVSSRSQKKGRLEKIPSVSEEDSDISTTADFENLERQILFNSTQKGAIQNEESDFDSDDEYHNNSTSEADKIKCRR